MITVENKRSIVSRLKIRRSALMAWLKREDPGCFSLQKHLRQGTPERVYWHYGYMMALRDMLRLLSRKSADAFRG